MANRKYDIIIIGYTGPNTFEEQIKNELKSRGHFVELIPTQSLHSMLSPFERTDYIIGSRYISLFSLLKKYYDYGLDFIIVCQTGFFLNNDLHIPLFYYHREFAFSPMIINPTHILINVPTAAQYLKFHHRYFWAHARSRNTLYAAANPKSYNPNREKDLKGLNYIGNFDPEMNWIEHIDPIWAEVVNDKIIIPLWATEQKLCTTHINGNVRSWPKDEEYTDLLERSESTLIVPIKWIYLSRRLIEAALCKTLIVTWIQNKESEEAYNKMGFYDRVNCIMFREKEDLANGAIAYTTEELKEMTENAYNLALEKHTYKNRVDHILNIFERRV